MVALLQVASNAFIFLNFARIQSVLAHRRPRETVGPIPPATPPGPPGWTESGPAIFSLPCLPGEPILTDYINYARLNCEISILNLNELHTTLTDYTIFNHTRLNCVHVEPWAQYPLPPLAARMSRSPATCVPLDVHFYQGCF